MSSINPCIFCQSLDHLESVEHIIPRTLGNLHYVLPKGTVCAKCNNRFARFENRVLSSQLFLAERKRLNLLRLRNQAVSNDLLAIDLQKFLLKMGYEALYKSRRKMWKQIDFTALLDLLLRGNANSMFQIQTDTTSMIFKPIPKWVERYRLNSNHLNLEYAELEQLFYFRFQFGRLRSCIRLQ